MNSSARVFGLIFAAATLHASIILYGVNGGLASTPVPPQGDLVIVDQTTGAVTPVGASGFPRLTGIGIEPNGVIYATTLGAIMFPPGPGQHSTTDLVRLSTSGSVLADIGRVSTASGSPVAIADLAVQPGTGALFGISTEFGAVPPGGLYTINPSNGVATLIGDTGEFFGSIAFAPNGTLYLVGAGFNMGPVNPILQVINPATAAKVGNAVPLTGFYGAFGIRPTDSVLFVGNGDEGQIFTLNPTTGVATPLPSTTLPSLVADLDFATPEPRPFVLMLLGLAAFALCRRL